MYLVFQFALCLLVSDAFRDGRPHRRGDAPARVEGVGHADDDLALQQHGLFGRGHRVFTPATAVGLHDGGGGAPRRHHDDHLLVREAALPQESDHVRVRRIRPRRRQRRERGPLLQLKDKLMRSGVGVPHLI